MQTQSQQMGESVCADFPIPENEPERLACLQDFEILDTEPDERFDRIVRLAANHFDAPICRVTFVDADRNWFKASIGANATQAPRSIAICSHSIMQDETLVVSDLSKDPRFADSPQVKGKPGFRFYAGAPIIVENGVRVGSICIIDTKPRDNFSSEDAKYLSDLAEIVAHELELHRQTKKQIHRLLNHDKLTGLSNRSRIGRLVRKSLHNAAASASEMAILYIDLDGFKLVNDTHGHQVGDELLMEVGRKLQTFTNEYISVGRMSGDEFVVLVDQVEDREAVARLANQVCESLAQPVQCSQDVIGVTSSIGVVIGPPEDNDTETLFRCADLALYNAKKDGRNCFRFFEEAMFTEHKQRQNLAAELRHAIDRNELAVHYQPIVDMHRGGVKGYEALVRWHSRKYGTVQPMQFIGLAEETGQVCEIGEWVLRTACAEAVKWPGNEFVSVNLSPIQFKTQDMLKLVESALSDTGLEPERLELEVTESVLIQNKSSVRETLRALSELGVSIALDDFGTGYSSLSYLTNLPFNKIKIDKSFVDAIEHDQKASSVVGLIIGLGSSLDMKIVAEGVEASQQHDLLRIAGCDQGQGYLYGKPLPDIIDPTQAANLKCA